MADSFTKQPWRKIDDKRGRQRDCSPRASCQMAGGEPCDGYRRHHGLLRAGRRLLRLPFGVPVSRPRFASQASRSLLSAYGRAITLEMHELSVAADDNIAFCHATMRCGCTGTSGQEHWSWLRSTVCMKKIDGRWLVAHDHCSAPFDPMTSQAMLDAGPEQLKKVA